MPDRVLKVMVSSTFRDLIPEREAARDAILGLGMLPLIMETDSAKADQGLLTSSFAKVDEADIYVLLISNYRYGQIVPGADLNPGNLSVTELEFERALARGLPICAYLMDDSVPPLSANAVFAEAATKPQLDAFRTRAQAPGRISANFLNPHDLKQKITQTLADLRAKAPAIASRAPPPPAADGIQPSPPERCLGRDADITRIVAALTSGARPAAVFVHGPGGIGKTTLTREAANHQAILSRFAGRRWFAELETATDRDTFDAQLLLALGLEPTRGFAAATHLLAQAPALLVLDNLETPWRGAETAIESRLGALAAIPGVVLLVSFRGEDAVGGVRWSLRHRVDPLPHPEARALFSDIANSIPDTDPHLPLLLQALGGVPLAICLTARRASPYTSLATLWAEWQRIGTELAVRPGGESGRLTSVPHSIALSLRSPRMNKQAERLFALLGPSPAGLSMRDRTALMGEALFAAEDALLAVGLAQSRGERLDLLPPVRDYARRRCVPVEADAVAWCRHFLQRAETEGSRIFWDGGAEALAVLTPEVANIDASLRAAPGLSQRLRAVGALNGYTRLLQASGGGSVLTLRWLSDACITDGDLYGEAECLYRAGCVALDRSDYQGAMHCFGRASMLFHQLNKPRDAAWCIQNLGDIAFLQSDQASAQVRYEEALPLFRSVSDLVGEANCIYRLGELALRRSDHDTTRVRFEEASLLYRRVGDVLGNAICIRSLGDIALSRSDYATAQARFEEAAPLFRRVGSVLGEANCIKSLGDIALCKSDHEKAEACIEAAMPSYRRVSNLLGEVNCIQRLGDIALRRSDHDTAALHYEETLPLYRRIGDIVGEANSLLGLGEVRYARGDAETAEHYFCATLPMFEQIHCIDGVAHAHERLATVTTGTERATHIQAAKDAWLSINLPDRADRVTRDLG